MDHASAAFGNGNPLRGVIGLPSISNNHFRLFMFLFILLMTDVICY